MGGTPVQPAGALTALRKGPDGEGRPCPRVWGVSAAQKPVFSFAGHCGPQPVRHVIVRERHPGGDGDLALGMLAGAATGMALGSLFWVF